MLRDAVIATLHERTSPKGFLSALTYFDAVQRDDPLSDFDLRIVEERAELPRFALDQKAITAFEDRLATLGVRASLQHDDDYPKALNGSTAPPPVLYVLGKSHRLNRTGLGICGSRNASPKGLAFAKAFGRAAAEIEAVEVSGYAKGVDTNAHLGSLEAGGETIVVLAEGIFHFRLKRILRALGDIEGRLTVISEFPVTRPWRVHSAMARNQTICALSAALVVVEAGSTGGTLDAGKKCLSQGKPLLVVQYGDQAATPEGNQELIKRGGLPVTSIKALKAAATRAMHAQTHAATQLRLAGGVG